MVRVKPLYITLSIFFFLSVSPAQQRSINICALRVDFQQDNSALTTGNGLFMDSTTTDSFAVDPAPHNRLYFQDQILAAANYFKKVSGGRVQISGDVFPIQENGAYHLTNKMGYYSPNTSDEEISLGLARLFTEAIELAKNDPENIDFSIYDLFVVFHAGVGKDIDVGYDNTPQDVSSLYITPQFLKDVLGDDYDGVDVGLDKPISSGIILPETENQEGYQIALTGMFVSNIGSYLELYDLFSPSKQSTGVGRFGLMDVGLMNMNGLIPSPPGAFSRQKLGWDYLKVINRSQNQISVKRLGSDIEISAPTIIQIPINEDEYYLIEYRGDSKVNLDSLYGVLAEDRQDVPSYLELLETEFSEQIERGESGVLISVPDYDWGIPGAGLLIWHIDERIIAEKGETKNINDDPEMRAVDIEEADGAQDMGQIYNFLDPGYYTSSGWFADFWYSGNPAFDGDRINEFSDVSSPNTRANRNQAVSHITLNNFSDNKHDIMTFTFKRAWLEDNFPVSLFDRTSATVTAVAGTIEDRAEPYFFTISDSGEIYAVNYRGQGLTDTSVTLFNQVAVSNQQPVLALADFDKNQKHDRLFASSGDSLYGFYLGTVPDNSKNFKTIGFDSKIITPPVISKGRVAVGCADGFVYIMDTTGAVLDDTTLAFSNQALLFNTVGNLVAFPEQTQFAAIAPFYEGQTNLLTFSDELKLYTYSGTNTEFLWSQTVQAVGPPAVIDVDDNGVYDLLFNQADGIYAYNRSGFLLNGFPLKVSLSENENLIGSPLILDADADGALDFLAVTDKGSIVAFKMNGRQLAGFPLTTGGVGGSTPIILQFDDDPQMELIAVNNSGSMYVWQLAVQEGDASLKWTSEYNSPGNNLLITQALNQLPLSSDLLPAKRVYNYPNPNSGDVTKIRYYLNEQAQVTIRIFDAAGMPVDEFDAPGSGGVDNEIEWNVADVASGVYLCQVKAKSADQTVSRIIKIMVIH